MPHYSIVSTRLVETFETATWEVSAASDDEATKIARRQADGANWISQYREVKSGSTFIKLIEETV